MGYSKALLQPPVRLRRLSERSAGWLRLAWTLAFAFAIIMVVVSAIYAVRASYWAQPTIRQPAATF